MADRTANRFRKCPQCKKMYGNTRVNRNTGEVIWICPFFFNKQKYCSYSCNTKSRAPERSSKPCIRCGGKIENINKRTGISISDVQFAKKKFCSKRCHVLRGLPAQDIKLRFRSMVGKIRKDGCLKFKGSINHWGYGEFFFNFDGRRIKVMAHRAAYAIAYGEAPPDHIVCHTCKKHRWCVNPRHLYLGDHLTNADDRDGRKRRKSQPTSNLRRGIKVSENNLMSIFS